MVIANGYDLNHFRYRPAAGCRVRASLGIADDALVVGHIARFDPSKDHAGFLRAAALVARAVPNSTFVLAGPGVDVANVELVGLLARTALQGRVKLLGAVSNVPDLMSALDVFCLSSQSEAFPNVLAEASASEVPSVATDVGDVRLILGNTGRIVVPNDEQALAAALVDLLRRTKGERQAEGAQARAIIEQRYSLECAIEQYSHLYGAVVGRTSRRSSLAGIGTK